MSRRQSWESVARQLGEQMRNHRFLECGHVMSEGLAIDCPFCEDAWAFYCYQARRDNLPEPVRPVQPQGLVADTLTAYGLLNTTPADLS